jgi:hypothetical protein
MLTFYKKGGASGGPWDPSDHPTVKALNHIEAVYGCDHRPQLTPPVVAPAPAGTSQPWHVPSNGISAVQRTCQDGGVRICTGRQPVRSVT